MDWEEGWTPEEEFQIVELSGEHPTLPISEALGAISGLGGSPLTIVSEPRALIYGPGVEAVELAQRLALARSVGPVLASGRLSDLREKAKGVDVSARTFRLRVADYRGSLSAASLEEEFGQLLAHTGIVDLERPQVDIRLVVSRQAYLYEVEGRVDRRGYDSRKSGSLPASRPVTLHPRLARALVNLTGVRRGERLLDPFCGTGGILAEAALVGAAPLGSDVSAEQLADCQENLEALQLRAGLRVLDVGEIHGEFGKVDAVATDPPYGRSTSTRGEGLPSLMKRAFATFGEVLRPGGRVAIALPQASYMDLAQEHLRPLEWHALKVHRSLVRHFALFEVR